MLQRRLGPIEKLFVLRSLIEDYRAINFSAASLNALCRVSSVEGEIFQCHADKPIIEACGNEFQLNFSFRDSQIHAQGKIFHQAGQELYLSLTGDWNASSVVVGKSSTRPQALKAILSHGEESLELAVAANLAFEPKGQLTSALNIIDRLKLIKNHAEGLGFHMGYQPVQDISLLGHIEQLIFSGPRILLKERSSSALLESNPSPYPDSVFLQRDEAAFFLRQLGGPAREGLEGRGGLPDILAKADFALGLGVPGSPLGLLAFRSRTEMRTRQLVDQALVISAFCQSYVFRSLPGQDPGILDFRPSLLILSLPSQEPKFEFKSNEEIRLFLDFGRRSCRLSGRISGSYPRGGENIITCNLNPTQPEDLRFLYACRFALSLNQSAAAYFLP